MKRVNGSSSNAASPSPVRCAVYTRKSTSEGLDGDFSTLDAQREAAEHYIRSQAASGWEMLDTHYDDGGFTGGNLERPALQRLLNDIENGRVDRVVVYKVDRLSRSLMDFARIVEKFDAHNVGFASITQQFDTSTSMGRLILNVLLSFAQFERELISERTRDKIAASRRRGKWMGGPPPLGYLVDRDRKCLVVDPEEAVTVRLVFETYLQTLSIGGTAKRLRDAGYLQKQHTTKTGRVVGGKPWVKNAVHRLLTNPMYIGKVRYRDEIHDGKHEPIVESELFEAVQSHLRSRSTGNRPRSHRSDEYLLAGLLFCGECHARMTPTYTNGSSKRYRYYRCRQAEQLRTPCSTGFVAADKIEAATVEELKAIVKHGEVKRAVLAQLDSRRPAKQELEDKKRRQKQQLSALRRQAARLLDAFKDNTTVGGKLLAEELGKVELEMESWQKRLGCTEQRLQELSEQKIDIEKALSLLDSFNEIWHVLTQAERCRAIQILVQRIVIDPGTDRMHLTFLEIAPQRMVEVGAGASTTTDV